MNLLKESYKVIPEFRSFLFSFKINNEQKIEALSNIFGDDFTALLSKFMKTLIENKRQDLIPDISNSYNLTAMESKNQLLVTAVTHEKLSDELTDSVKKALEKSFDKDVRIESTVDPSIIGGIKLRIGNTVIDGSVRGSLTRLRETLLS
ncbi:MAG: ATP synthase F1 subunit delta [Candidatus Marinimicrobia bacterium]|nr:ATP synthase F1 subunit delta [Candidatus Neomarinimicrobiota bacterium]